MPGSRKPERSQTRRDWTVAVWVLFILGLVFGLPFAIIAITSKPAKPPVIASPTETVASCAGPKPHTPLRDPGPFTAPTQKDVDANHIFVATIKTYCGNLLLKIDPKNAPDAARSFVFLAQKRFYDGLPFNLLFPNTGIALTGDETGYTVPGRIATRRVARDVIMTTTSDRVSSSFAILTGSGSQLAGPVIGSILEGDAQSNTTFSRLIAQPAKGTTLSPPVYIIHIEIQEFER